MTKDTTPAPTLADYPQAIQWNWNQRAAELAAVANIDAKLPALDAEIQRVRRELAELTEHYARYGRERTAHLENADLLSGLVHGWCQEHDLPMPPEPEQPAEPEPEHPHDPRHDAGIWERRECACGGRIIRNQLSDDPWRHEDGGRAECFTGDGPSPVAVPKPDPADVLVADGSKESLETRPFPEPAETVPDTEPLTKEASDE